jgi:hypothetical protein
MNRKILFIAVLGSVLFACQPVTAQKIPFFFEGHLYLDGIINGRDSGHFIMDTGADGLYLDSLFYSRMGTRFTRVAHGMLPGVGEGVQEVTILLDTVVNDLNGFSCKTPRSVVMNLKSIVGCRADGMIGISFFLKKIVEINYSNRFIRISDQSKADDLSDYQRIAIKLTGNRIYIPLKVALSKDIKVEGDFLLDLGSASAISLTSKTAAALDLAARMDKPGMHIVNRQGGAGGMSERVDIRAHSVTFGTLTLDNLVAQYSLDKAGALASDKYKGLVGNELLKHFDLVIDFPNKILYYKPGKEFSKPFVSNRLGFQYADRSDIAGGWIVNGIYNPSAARSAGLQTGDVITMIKGKAVAGITREQVSKELDTSPSISLTVKRNGKTILLEYAVKETI